MFLTRAHHAPSACNSWEFDALFTALRSHYECLRAPSSWDDLRQLPRSTNFHSLDPPARSPCVCYSHPGGRQQPHNQVQPPLPLSESKRIARRGSTAIGECIISRIRSCTKYLLTCVVPNLVSPKIWGICSVHQKPRTSMFQSG